MSKRQRLMSAAVLSGVLAVGVTFARVEIPQVLPLDSRCEAVEKAYKAAMTTKDLSDVKRELRKLFGDPRMEVKVVALEWIGRHEDTLTPEQADELLMSFVELNPNEPMSASVRRGIAERHFILLPVGKRAEVCLEAVKNGETLFERQFRLVRTVALGVLANDGLAEFEPLVRQYAKEIDTVSGSSIYKESDYLLWVMKLRSGACDRADGYRLQALRLSQMEPEEFFNLMEKDSAFKWAAAELVPNACKEPLSEACVSLAKVAYLQQELIKRGLVPRSSTAGGPPSANEGPSWLGPLVEKTRTAMPKVRPME